MEEPKKKVEAKNHENYNSYTLITFLIPIVGFILGIMFLAKDKALDKKFGEHLLAFSILAAMVQYALYELFLKNYLMVGYYTPIGL